MDKDRWQSFKDLGMEPYYEAEEALEKASVVIDCTPVGNENKEKYYKRYANNGRGFIAQGSEFGFGKMYARGINDKALDRASRSISVLEKLTVPANVDPARFMAERNQYLASNYASMGSALLTKFEEARNVRREKQAASAPPVVAGAANQPPGPAKGSSKSAEPATGGAAPDLLPPDSPEVIALAKAQGYFVRSLELNPDYDFARFQLGIVYAYQNKAEQALESFARTVALNGNFVEMARQNLEAIYKVTHKNSLEGLEEFIAKFKTQPAATQAPRKIDPDTVKALKSLGYVE